VAEGGKNKELIITNNQPAKTGGGGGVRGGGLGGPAGVDLVSPLPRHNTSNCG